MNLKPLTKNQIACGKVLLECIAKGQYTIEYNEIEKLTGVSIRRIGAEIGELSKHCHKLGMPLISVMVINKETRCCGEGFFYLCFELNVHSEFKKSMKKMFEACMEEVKNYSEWYKFADYMGIEIKGLKPINNQTTEIINSERTEGSLIQINTTKYERDEKLRTECLRIHGTTCKICGFDAGKIYGQEFGGKIHIHHIIPLGQVKQNHIVNPETDLIPICPNCHMIIHSKKDGVYMPEDIIKMMEKMK